ncbi:SAPS-domain-containing protein [Sodiomyces alkalinus F11]|uniref:SAPS-domain-containing protein n=1 Tax=Sodiomyces alkalinus (strain CBS 110278 / VKM F-3762 / F11) TaxID=1314773 RepID=A0A3N2PUW9_SODAK|nr:SAPS-domain-containing protein [Sodiomyces alkalinus F11]ROT38302.1 SAPS-domain-containing protein [Sodiomyces alkalinus F11]
MFWRFGGYANISPIDTILEKPDFTIEDLLDEGELIQELKSHNAKLIDYLRQDDVLAKLLEYVVAPKLEPVASPGNDGDDQDGQEEGNQGKSLLRPFSRPRASSRESDASADEEQERKRNRYAYIAAEVLSSDTWSIYDALLENEPLIRRFWTFLQQPTPLDPLQASYFTKVNEALFDKKTEEMVNLLKSLPEAIPHLARHVESPMIMDLLLKIVALDRTEGGQGIVEWLYSQDLVPTLLAFLSPENNWVVQTAAGDFIKAIITISANASQNDQQCIGPNELTRQLVSQPCIEQLIQFMLHGGNPLTVGVGIVIEVIRKNNSDYDPDVGSEANSVPSSRDPIYLGTLLRLFAQHVPDFVNLIMRAPAQTPKAVSTFGNKIEPLGFDRFKTCELMAELLHCSNMGLLNEVGSEELIAARDAERHRLRREGRLSPNRGEEAHSTSVDDMTLHMSQSSPEEGRRLEVTNISDDDGFEQVEPSREMNEDTSHEFVKAEEEIPAAPAPATSSFLDKDDGDFVDEPLSSPRLHVSDAKMTEQEFEDADLMVAPLSPTKQKTPSSQDPAEIREPKPEAPSDLAAKNENEGTTREPMDIKTESEPDTKASVQPNATVVTGRVDAAGDTKSETKPTEEKDGDKAKDLGSSAVNPPFVAEPKPEPKQEPKPEPESEPKREQSPEEKPVAATESKPSTDTSIVPPAGPEVPAPLFSDSSAPAVQSHEDEKSTDKKTPTPMAVDTPDVSQTTPEAPGSNWLPVVHEAPKAAEASVTAEPSAISGAPKTQEASASTESPAVPGARTVPEIQPVSQGSDAPQVPEVPEVPEVSFVPEAPEVPAAPELPEAPEAPEVPEAPEPPRMTSKDGEDAAVFSGPLPLAPEVPEAPDVPEVPHAPPAPHPPPAVVGDYLKMQFVEYNVVPIILSFFFAYPWNNFLHNVVYDIVQQVFNGPMDRGFNPTLAVSLFESADITKAIIDGQLASDESQAKRKTRMGYMGHLTLIAEEVVKFTERHPPELLSETVLDRVMDQSWINYVEGALAETRERDNAILGGVRPEVALGGRAAAMPGGGGLPSAGFSGLGPSFGGSSQGGGGSSALAEAGLNGGMDLPENSGNGNGGIGPFAISAGTLMSGFGSSSDEDDDDTEDNEEDVNNEFRAYTEPLNNQSSSTSMNPPSIPPPPPPPPPPLNIPPSRARMQLAARLALHQKNQHHASGGDAQGGNSGGAGDDNRRPGSREAARERLRNPFADDDDGDDDMDSDDEGEGEGAGGPWRSSVRGSWWRGVVRRRQTDRFGGGGDSDSDQDDAEDEDDEFGDFTMPEAEPAPGTDPTEKVLFRPLAVHPPAAGSSSGYPKTFTGLWPFGPKEEKTEAQVKDEDEDKGKGKGRDNGKGKETEGGNGGEEEEEEEEKKKRAEEEDKSSSSVSAPAASPGAEEEGDEKVQAAVEAKRRTSIEDPEEDEIVVQKP